jgi:8-hydroxy-5-deazaflavin:NADPH oxidoreductase
MAKKIGIIGSGMVGVALANGLQKHGFKVKIGTNNPEKHAQLAEKLNKGIGIDTFKKVAKFGDMVILAVKGTAAKEAIKKAGVKNLENKTVLDATNPIADAPPQNGNLIYFTKMNQSLMEILQEKAPKVNFVKCFSCVGNGLMIDPDFGGIKPTMFIAGNNEVAKSEATTLLEEIGWEAEDMGKVESARGIEALCILWCAPGFNKNQWSYAFKLLKQ